MKNTSSVLTLESFVRVKSFPMQGMSPRKGNFALSLTVAFV